MNNLRLRTIILTFACVTVAACSDDTQTTPEATTNDPLALFAQYVRSVEAGDDDAVVGLLSDDPMRPTYPACTADMSNKACLAMYLRDTVVTQHTTFVEKSVELAGNTVNASLEVRSDLTRTLGIDRLLGVDQVAVTDNRIVSFQFVANFSDDQTARFFAALGIKPTTP